MAYYYTKKGVWSLNEVADMVNLNAWDEVKKWRLYGYGVNTHGEVGISSIIAQRSPVQVSSEEWGLFNSGDGTVFAQKSDGTLWAWGRNNHGQLGINDTTPRSSPVQVGSGNGGIYDAIDVPYFRRFSIGIDHALAIKNDGSLWSWGHNNWGQLGLSGDQKASDYYSRSNLSRPIEIFGSNGWSLCSTGRLSSLAIRGEGALFCWGHNGSGQLGQNNTTSYSSPVQVVGQWRTASMFRDSAMGFKVNDDYVYVWGDNTYGQLGLSDTSARSSPIQHSRGWKKIKGSYNVMVGIKTDNTMWAWGRGDFGVLGQDLIIRNVSPTGSLGTSWTGIEAPILGNHHVGIKTNGTLFTFGTNNFGELGISTSVTVATNSSPVQIPGTTWSLSDAGTNTTYALKSDGTLWSWGRNDNGQLGINTTINYSSPVQIPGTSWVNIYAGTQSAYAIRTNGTIWSWGRNNSGQLGLSDNVDRSSPVQIGALTTWSTVGAGVSHVFFLRSDSNLFACGDNSFGQLGVNNRTNALELSQVIGANYKQPSAGNGFSLAVRNDNTLWAWGLNDIGQLGQSNLIPRSSPVQIPGSDWALVKCGDQCTFALKTNGTLWAWGRNDVGQLGTGDFINRSSPVQVGAGTTGWLNTSTTKFSVGQRRTFAIQESNNTLYFTGLDIDLGFTNAIISYSSPVQIPGTTWDDFDFSETNIIAKKLDGTQWNWGRVAFLQSGIGTNVTNEYLSSPVQIEGTGWDYLSIGYNSIIGVKTA